MFSIVILETIRDKIKELVKWVMLCSFVELVLSLVQKTYSKFEKSNFSIFNAISPLLNKLENNFSDKSFA